MSNQMKSKTLIQLLHQQQTQIQNDETLHDSNQSLDLKRNQAIADLHDKLKTMMINLNDQQIFCQIKKQITNEQTNDISHLLNNIKVFFLIMIQAKQELDQELEKRNISEQNEYENGLQKLEAEVRQHIRIEQQLKLYAEATQQKLEDLTVYKEQQDQLVQRLKIEVDQQNVQFQNVIMKYQDEINKLRSELKKYQQNPQILVKQQSIKNARTLNYDHKEYNEFQYRPDIRNLDLEVLNKNQKKYADEKNDQQLRTQTEPNDETTKYKHVYMDGQLKQNMRLSTQQSEILSREKPSDNNLRYNVQSKQEIQKMRRNYSNKVNIIQKQRNENISRIKSFSKQSQNSIDYTDDSGKSKRMKSLHIKSTGNTIDAYPQKHQRPFSTIDNPANEFENDIKYQKKKNVNDSRSQSHLVSQTTNIQQQNVVYNDNSQQQIKHLIQTFQLRKLGESIHVQKPLMDRRLKKQSSKTQHY